MKLLDNMVIPKSSDSEQKRLINYVSRYVGQEFSRISEPCYYLKISKVWKDIVYLTGIDKDSISAFKKNLPAKYSVRQILADPASILIIIAIVHYMRNNKKEYAKLFYRLLTIRFYSSTIHKYMKYCNPDMWSFAMDRLSSKHLFKVENGISNAMLYLSDVEFEKKWKSYRSGINGIEDESKFVNDLVYNLRHRINQSFNSFANSYYTYSSDKDISVRSEREDEVKQDKTFIPEKISISITTHGQIDRYSIAIAIKKSGIRPDLAANIIDKISNVGNREKIRFILILMDRIIELNRVCREKDRNLLVRRIMNNVKVHTYVVRDVIEKFLSEVDTDYKIRTANMLQVVSFFSTYLVTYIQRKICV